jgi:hypothetical protein
MGKDCQLNIRCDDAFKAQVLRDCAAVDEKAKFEVSNAAIMRSALSIGLGVLMKHPEFIVDIEKNGSQ